MLSYFVDLISHHGLVERWNGEKGKESEMECTWL